MWRRLRSACTITSFIVLLVFARLWDRSYYVLDYVSGIGSADVWSRRGEIGLHTGSRGRDEWQWDAYPLTSSLSQPETPKRQALGFGFSTIQEKRRAGVVTNYLVTLPYWFFAAMAATLPTLAVLRFRQRWLAVTRAVLRRCPRCDYDLTGNTSGLCPECGESIEAEVRNSDSASVL